MNYVFLAAIVISVGFFAGGIFTVVRNSPQREVLSLMNASGLISTVAGFTGIFYFTQFARLF